MSSESTGDRLLRPSITDPVALAEPATTRKDLKRQVERDFSAGVCIHPGCTEKINCTLYHTTCSESHRSAVSEMGITHRTEDGVVKFCILAHSTLAHKEEKDTHKDKDTAASPTGGSQHQDHTAVTLQEHFDIPPDLAFADDRGLLL